MVAGRDGEQAERSRASGWDSIYEQKGAWEEGVIVVLSVLSVLVGTTSTITSDLAFLSSLSLPLFSPPPSPFPRV